MGLVEIATQRDLDQFAYFGTRIRARGLITLHRIWLFHHSKAGEEAAYHQHAATCLREWLAR